MNGEACKADVCGQIHASVARHHGPMAIIIMSTWPHIVCFVKRPQYNQALALRQSPTCCGCGRRDAPSPTELAPVPAASAKVPAALRAARVCDGLRNLANHAIAIATVSRPSALGSGPASPAAAGHFFCDEMSRAVVRTKTTKQWGSHHQ